MAVPWRVQARVLYFREAIAAVEGISCEIPE